MSFRHPNPYSDVDTATRLVGRERERGILQTWFRNALAGRGGVVLLGGEAGIGKTRLVQHLTNQSVDGGAHVFVGHSYDLTTNLPFSPWTEILQEAREIHELPESLASLVDGDVQDVGIESADFPGHFLQYFRQLSTQNPAVVVLEDLHWSDPASQDLLRILGRVAEQLPLLVLGTYRDDEIKLGGNLYRLMPHIVRESRAIRMTLQRLGIEETRGIVDHRYNLPEGERNALASYVHKLSDGNPFFIHELLDTLEEEQLLRPGPDSWTLAPLETPVVPPLVEQIVEGRLDRLDVSTRYLLGIAAVIGQSVQYDLWQAISQVENAELIRVVQEARRNRLLDESPDGKRLRFSHAIVREVLYKRLVLPERQELHRRIAEALQESPVPDASVIGQHYALADDPRAIEWLIRGARRANALHAPRTAIETVSTLLHLAENFSVPVSTEAYAIRGQARSVIGDFEGARDDYEQVLSSASAAGNYEWAGEPYVSLGMLWADRDSQQLDQYLQTALKLARESNEQLNVVHSLNRIGNWLLNVCRPEEAVEYHKEALAIAEEIEDLNATAITLQLLGMACMIWGDLIQAAGYYRRAAEIFTALNNKNHLAYSLANLLNCSLSLANDTLVLASANTEDLIEPDGIIPQIARDGGWPLRELYGLQIISLSWAFLGEYGTALQVGERALAIAREQEHRQWDAHVNWRIGLLFLNILAVDEARQHIERSLSLARELGAEIHVRAANGLLASAHILGGDLDRAETLLSHLKIGQEARPATNQDRYSWCALIDLHLARNEAERALTVVDRLIETTLNYNPEQGVARLSKLRGEALLALERFDEAGEELDRARSEACRLDARPMLWRIDALRARLYATRGDQNQAVAAYDAAASMIDELAGTLPKGNLRDQFVRQAFGLLPPRPEAARKRSGAGSEFSLTDRELEVLRLVARGLTDAEVGEKLFISPRTVNAHMRSIHRKLNVTSRAAATRHAIEHGLI